MKKETIIADIDYGGLKMVHFESMQKAIKLRWIKRLNTMSSNCASWCASWSIAAQKFATSTLMTAPLKVVTIECIEHEVTCLNERVFIKTMNHLLTNCSQSTLLGMNCRLSLLVLNTS